MRVKAVHIENSPSEVRAVLCGAWARSGGSTLRIVAADDPRATCKWCLKKARRGQPIPFWGISQDSDGVWHVWAAAQEILSTGDREYAIRALMRQLERQVAKGTEVL